MLAGLGHDAFVGGDDEQDQIDTGGSGQHVFHETLVARYVHDSDSPSAGEVEMSETQVDGHAAALLFFQPIGVNSGESFDQRTFAVVNVACCSHDKECSHDAL